jgi:hypothetical protein
MLVRFICRFYFNIFLLCFPSFRDKIPSRKACIVDRNLFKSPSRTHAGALILFYQIVNILPILISNQICFDTLSVRNGYPWLILGTFSDPIAAFSHSAYIYTTDFLQETILSEGLWHTNGPVICSATPRMSEYTSILNIRSTRD